VVAKGLAGLNRYPDGAARALRRALADRHGVGPEQVVIGNGSCELILMAGQALLDPGATVIHADPSFAIYPHLGAAAGAEAIAVPLAADGGHDLEAMAAAVDGRARLLVVCNPNNPTGVYRPSAAVEALLDAVPADLAVLVDEAYFDFVDAPDADAVMAMARERDNLLVTRTFSKAYGLCGLRVGYGVGGAGWVAALDQVRQPFNTNALAQAAALESLAHPAAIGERARLIVSERRRVSRELARRGWAFTPSQTNFILLEPGPEDTPEGPALHERLLRRGVIVRDGAALGCEGRIRVSIGAPDENTAFLSALADVSAPLTHPGPGRTSP
jgi:histidinol-phosphate aminotransferase